MKTIFSEAAKAVKNGAKFHFDFKTKTLRVGKRKLIEHGIYEGELGVLPQTMEETVERLEYLYTLYRFSLPSERNTGKFRRYFLALPEEELSTADMMFGQYREVAQFYLEFFMMASVINGSFKMNDNHWYWMSQKCDGLVVYREWFE